MTLLLLFAVSCSKNHQVKVVAKNKNTGAPLTNRNCYVTDDEHRDGGALVLNASTDNNGEAILSFNVNPGHFITVTLGGNSSCLDVRWRGEARDLPSEIEFKCE